jgi:hypothetical protein
MMVTGNLPVFIAWVQKRAKQGYYIIDYFLRVALASSLPV